jgi:hypothetical protein
LRYDITKERKPTLGESILGAGRESDPSVSHTMRVPRSIKTRMIRVGNKMVVRILDEKLPVAIDGNVKE